jgi:phosphoglycolate phosphatase
MPRDDLFKNSDRLGSIGDVDRRNGTRYRRAMTYRLAIFDLDGTLSDSFPWFLQMVNAIADKHAFRQIEPDQIEMLRGKTSREIITFLRVPRWKLPFIARDMRRLKTPHLSGIPLFPGVERMLHELSARGVLIAAVSSDSETNVRQALGTSARFVSCYACGASLFGKAKKFKQVLKRTGVPARDAVCVGDEVRDGEAAHEAGIAFAAVTWGYAGREALERIRPAWIVERVDDLVPSVTSAADRRNTADVRAS